MSDETKAAEVLPCDTWLYNDNKAQLFLKDEPHPGPKWKDAPAIPPVANPNP